MQWLCPRRGRQQCDCLAGSALAQVRTAQHPLSCFRQFDPIGVCVALKASGDREGQVHRQGEHEKQVLRFAQDDKYFIFNEINKFANIFYRSELPDTGLLKSGQCLL
jgi:hypothetical protein